MPFGADPYATRTDLLSGIGGVAAAVVDDDAADLALESASDQIDGWCGRRFDSDGEVGDPATRDLRAKRPDWVSIPDAVSLSRVEVRRSPASAWETLAASDWELQRSPRFGDDRPYTSLSSPTRRFPCSPVGQLSNNVRLTGVFGWAAVPTGVTQATIILAARLMGRGGTPYGAQEIGAVTVFVRLDDPDVLRLLRTYRRRSLGV